MQQQQTPFQSGAGADQFLRRTNVNYETVPQSMFTIVYFQPWGKFATVFFLIMFLVRNLSQFQKGSKSGTPVYCHLHLIQGKMNRRKNQSKIPLRQCKDGNKYHLSNLILVIISISLIAKDLLTYNSIEILTSSCHQNCQLLPATSFVKVFEVSYHGRLCTTLF